MFPIIARICVGKPLPGKDCGIDVKPIMEWMNAHPEVMLLMGVVSIVGLAILFVGAYWQVRHDRAPKE